MREKPLKVLVCGSNYGRIYIDAIRMKPRLFELAGIFARGSTRSMKVAQRHGVPLICRVEDIPADLDLACAAMGASGNSVMLDLINRGIDVIAEHPQPPGILRAALRKADARRRCFHLNAHLALLPAPEAFREECGKLARPEILDVVATDRSLYAVLDLLCCAFGTLRPFRFRVIDSIEPFVMLRGVIGGIAAVVRVQLSRQKDGSTLVDGSSQYLSDCHITVASRGAVLSLLSANGPVVWNEKGFWRLVGPRPASEAATFYKHRVRANLKAMTALAEHSRRGTIPTNQDPCRILEVSTLWEHLCEKIGFDGLL